MRTLDIGIVGCGTAGQAAALFLSRAGHRTTLIERVAQPTAIGAGIVMQPTGLAALARLGIEEPILAAGARLDGLRCFRRDSWSLLALRYERLGPNLFGLGLHRGVLFQALHDAVLRSTVHRVYGSGATRLEAHGDRHAVRLDNGLRTEPFDLVVVADGARSQLRAAHANARTRRYPFGALWFVGNARDYRSSELVQVVDGTRTMIGLLPTGLGPDRSRGPLTSLFYSVAEARVDELRRGSIEVLKDEVRAVLPVAAPLVDQVQSWDDLLFAAYHDVLMSRWHDRGIVYLGDAAHATSPQLGQGCNLALVDASTLADALAANDELPLALAQYSRRRKDVLGFYQRATRWLTPLFQSDDEALGTLRDLIFPVMTKVPFFERRMLESMAGLSTGILSADRP